MKRLDILILKSFIGPFVLTTVVSTFILLIQYMLKYFDDFVGKDLGFDVFAQLIFYFSLNMAPVALPLGVLLSSLMTFGNLGEHFELTAIKSSGISLLRALRPIFLFVVLLSIGAYHFNNIVVPAANLEAYRLLFDIKQTKPGLDIREGQFYDGLEGYSIKVKEKLSDNKTLKDVIIYDHTDKSNRGNNRVILADSSIMYTILNERYLKFELYNGHYYNEIPKKRRSKKEYNQFVRNEFAKMEMVFSLAGFDKKQTKKELFENNRQMKNIDELTNDIDSLGRLAQQARQQNMFTTLAYHEYYQSDRLKTMRDSVSQANKEKRQREKELEERQKELDKKNDSLKIAPEENLDTLEKEVKTVRASLLGNVFDLIFQQDTTTSSSGQFKIQDEQEKALIKRSGKDIKKPKIDGNAAIVKSLNPSDSGEMTASERKNLILPPDSIDTKNTAAKKVETVQLDTTLVARTQEDMDKYFEKRLGADNSIISAALAKARNIKNGYTNAKTKIRNYQKTMYKFTVEKNKKYAQSFACIVMFLIGAPLGAIIKRGGLGVPVIVSIFFFIIYYVITITSHKWAKEGFVDGRIAVWYANMILLPIGLYFLNRARVDARIFDVDVYLIWIDKLKTRFSKAKPLVN